MSKALRQLSKSTPSTPADMEELGREFTEGSDRTIAILIGALIEDDLRKSLRSQMMNLTSDEEERLFENNGPLATFSAKIEVAYAFGFIGPNTRHDLNLLRAIRNAQAHAKRAIPFDNPVLLELLDKFYAGKEFKDYSRMNPGDKMRSIMKALRLEMLFKIGAAPNTYGEARPFPERTNRLD